MPMPWFRFYTEFAHDPKVQTLPISWRFAFIMILCWHAEGELSKLPDRVKAKIFEMTMEELDEMREAFTDLGFIEDGWTPKNWEKRQRASDSSTERSRACRERKRQAATVAQPLQNGSATVSLLISSSSLTTNACIKEEEKDTRTATVAQPLQDVAATVAEIKQPSYPEPTTTMHHVDTGPHEIDDATARDIWGRIWAAWKDESLCIGWYRWQQQYQADTWVAAFSQTKEQYPNQKVTIGLVAKIAAGIAANGRKEAKPFASLGNGRPKTKREERAEATARKLAELRERIGDDNDIGV